MLLLLAFWLILSPAVSVQSVAIGIIVSILVVLYSQDIVFSEAEITIYSLGKLKIFIHYMYILLVEIVKANIDVAKVVLSPSMPVSPSFIKVHAVFNNDFNKVIYANSVTLTPGTLTVDVRGNDYIIHALTDAAAEGMNNSILEQYVRKLEVGGNE
jgi:multicomponent Na+:H+ antiporter subunit E